MPAADGVLAGVYVLLEANVVVGLDEVHAFSVELLDALPDLAVGLVVISEVVLLAPVAEISGEDEESGWVIEVRREYLAVVVGHLRVDWADHDRHDFHFFPKCLDDERQVHLDAVLVLLIIEIQHEEPLFLLQPVHHFDIDVERAKRSVVLIHVG